MITINLHKNDKILVIQKTLISNAETDIVNLIKGIVLLWKINCLTNG